jgi:hypothetical protein
MNFWGCSGTGFVVFCGLCFFQFLTPSTLRVGSFLISNPFLKNFSGLDAPRGEIQVVLDTRNNGALPLDPACPERLSVRSPAVLL